jgi:hypothetical protein
MKPKLMIFVPTLHINKLMPIYYNQTTKTTTSLHPSSNATMTTQMKKTMTSHYLDSVANEPQATNT